MKLLVAILLSLLALLAAGFLFYKYSTIDKGRNDFTWTQPEIDRASDRYSIMTVNIGNSDLDCRPYRWKLCKKGIEARLAKNIQAVAADIITIQEALAPWQCARAPETDPENVCSEAQADPQSRRLLGEAYTIVCDPGSQHECFGLRKDVGEIEGCAPGELCYTARAAFLPEGCDDGFSISAVTVRLNNGAVFDLVNVHPASFSEACRADLLQRAFVGDGEHPPILERDHVLIMGDFNFDPWRTRDSSSQAWQEIFAAGWRGRRYHYHSAITEAQPPRYTFRFVKQQTLDLVISNFAHGVCQVLGETPGTTRLDGGSGNDHRAVYGILEIKP